MKENHKTSSFWQPSGFKGATASIFQPCSCREVLVLPKCQMYMFSNVLKDLFIVSK